MTELEKSQYLFWKIILKHAHDGISMNSIIPRQPDSAYRNDACEYGLGGFSLRTGRAWRFEIPVDCIGKRSINFLEFLAAVVSIMLGILEGEIQSHDNVCWVTAFIYICLLGSGK
jgi:hypothetical protein